MAVDHSGVIVMGNAGSAGRKRTFPREFRRGMFRRIDIGFWGIALACAAVLYGGTYLLSLREIPDTMSERDILKIQERYAQLVLDQPKPQPEEPEVTDEKPSPAEKKSVEKKPEKEKKTRVDRTKETYEEKQKRKAASREERARVRERIRSQVTSTGIFAAITAAASSGSPASGVSDLLGATEHMADVRDIRISSGTFASRAVDPSSLSKRRGSTRSGVDIEKRQTGTIAGARIASGGNVAITSKDPEISGSSEKLVTTSKACIQRIVNRQSVRLRRVYETWLKRDPALNGQIKVKFVIMPTGAATNAAIVRSTTGNARFDKTILRYIGRWNFASCGISSRLEIIYPFIFSSNPQG